MVFIKSHCFNPTGNCCDHVMWSQILAQSHLVHLNSFFAPENVVQEDLGGHPRGEKLCQLPEEHSLSFSSSSFSSFNVRSLYSGPLSSALCSISFSYPRELNWNWISQLSQFYHSEHHSHKRRGVLPSVNSPQWIFLKEDAVQLGQCLWFTFRVLHNPPVCAHQV